MNGHEKLIEKINSFTDPFNIMEVCGTHTMAISRSGIRNALKENINLISGPGCPVCVTPDSCIDYIYSISLKKDVIIATYGDMIRVPGSNPKISLERAKALGADVRMVYSSIDALEIASKNRNKKVVFIGIGFETTAPAAAAAIIEAEENEIDNFYVFSVHRNLEPVMRYLILDRELNISGFLCPGHVAAIIGTDGFKFLSDCNMLGVVTGFELDEILEGIYILLEGIKSKKTGVINAYKRLIKPEGNEAAKSAIHEVFEKKDDYIRGIGKIPECGLKIRDKYKNHDIERIYPFTLSTKIHNNGCRCGDVIKGKIKPTECPLFRKVCTPLYPVGPCMVSSEGSCAAYFKYSYTV